MNYLQVLFLIGRIIFGGFFVLNGLNHFMKHKMLTNYAASKNVPMASFAVLVSGAFLLLGGLGIVLGIYVRWSALLLVLFLVPVSFMMHNFWTIEDPTSKMNEMVQFMKNMALLGATLMVLYIPEPWVYTVKSLFSK